MTADDFDYLLPPELIAQRPLERRDASRLMVVDRATGARQHRRFDQIVECLRPGDLLVLNDARVIPARLLGRKAATGGRAELLLVRPAAGSPAHAALDAATEALEWLCLGQSSKGFKPGMALQFDGGLQAQVIEALGGGEYRVRFTGPSGSLASALERSGRLPLPPYIDREPDAADAQRYQTVYASRLGSVAAPTAGLHFTPELLTRLEQQGIDRAHVTLDVGPGTFLPVREGDLRAHVMHAERCAVSQGTADAVNRARREGRRVVAVGTTVVRTLESFASDEGQRAGEADTRIFISPGYTFRAVDALLTNLHLPRSTLLMLVSAFMGREQALLAYAEAVRERYRFFSYGDAMFIA